MKAFILFMCHKESPTKIKSSGAESLDVPFVSEVGLSAWKKNEDRDFIKWSRFNEATKIIHIMKSEAWGNNCPN